MRSVTILGAAALLVAVTRPAASQEQAALQEQAAAQPPASPTADAQPTPADEGALEGSSDTPVAAQPSEEAAAQAAGGGEAEANPSAEAEENKERQSARVAETDQDADDDPFNIRDPKPKKGTGLIITGWIFVGVGALNLATSPLCHTDSVREEDQDLCFKLSLGVAVAGAVVGIPLLIAGYNQKANYDEWKKRHSGSAWLLDTQLTLVEGGAALSYSRSF